MERRYTAVGGSRIHSAHYGEGPDVVLLHGLAGSRHWWRYTVPALADSYHVHVPELVGFGRSRAGWRQPPLTELARQLGEWLGAVGIVRPHFVGHSMGGQIALHLAVEQRVPLRSLTLVDASGLPRPRGLREARRLLLAALPPRRWGVAGFLPTIVLDAMRSGPRRVLLAGHSLLRDDVTSLLSQVDVPTLLIWGALDPLVPLEDGQRMARGIPNARLVVLAEAAHNPQADSPSAFNRVLLDFLDHH